MPCARSSRWLLLLALAAPAAARAQHTSYDLERLWLDPSARGSLVLGSGETLPKAGLRLAVGGGWERSPLVLLDNGNLRGRGLFASGHRLGDVVKDRWMLQAALAAGLTDRLELGLRVPWIISQSGSDLTADGVPKLRKEMIGTVSGMARYGITQQARGSAVSSAVAFEVAASPQRLGGGDEVDGEPRTLLVPRVEVGRRMGSFLLAADLGAIFRTRGLQLPEKEVLRQELTAGLVAATTGAPLRVEASLRGAFNADGLGPHGELLAGARLGVSRYLELFALAGPGLGTSPGTPTFRALVGLALQTPEPAAPAPEPSPQAEPPPEPAPVVAAPDPCAPGEAHTPQQCPALDDDGDGIANGEDQCPEQAGITEMHGCPAVDSDGDGIPDHLDKCPDQPGVAEYQGCPPPEPPRAELGAGKIDIKEKVFFDTGKAVIQQRSNPLLDDVARLIVANPQVGVIRIEGHTDDRGRAPLNRMLSLARANAVRDYLVSKGVDPARLQTQGFGPDRPAQPNTTAAGREANRRVEFVILGAGAS